MDSTFPVQANATVPVPRAEPRQEPVEPRRVARLVPAGSPQWVVLEVVRGALEPAWVPIDAARALLTDVDDLRVLRSARARLRTPAENRMTLCQARALATLNMAIGVLEGGAPAEPAASRSRVHGKSER